jgi:hypothetical protein
LVPEEMILYKLKRALLTFPYTRWVKTYRPLMSLGSLFSWSISFSSLPVRASGLVWACFLNISSNFSGTNL